MIATQMPPSYGRLLAPDTAGQRGKQALGRIPRQRGWDESGGQGWPLWDFLELGALEGSVPCARYHARQILWEWRLTRHSEDVELLVAELVTNAVSASRCLDWPHPVRMWLLSDAVDVLLLVWDASPLPPALIDPARDAESGRGLLLVDAIASRWDWYVLPDAGGKMIYALVTG